MSKTGNRPATSTMVTIGRAAEQAEVNVETIRFYERKGLIEQPPKRDGEYRRYGADHISRVRFIREAQQLGFALSEIAELLDLRSDPDARCEEVRQRTIDKQTAVRAKIRKLQKIDDALGALIDECPRKGRLENCPIIASLDKATRE